MLAALVVMLRSLALICWGRRAVALESLALRQQSAVFRRTDPRPHFRHRDRLFWVVLAQAWRDCRTALIVVRPGTVVRWHRQWLRRRNANESSDIPPPSQDHGPSDGRVDRSATHRGTSGRIRPALAATGSGRHPMGTPSEIESPAWGGGEVRRTRLSKQPSPPGPSFVEGFAAWRRRGRRRSHGAIGPHYRLSSMKGEGGVRRRVFPVVVSRPASF